MGEAPALGVDALVAGVEPGESVDEASLTELTEALDDLTTDALDEAFADVYAAWQTAIVTAVAGFGIVAALATAAAISGR